VKRLNYKRTDIDRGFFPEMIAEPILVYEPEINLGASLSTLIQNMLADRKAPVSTRLSE